MDGKDFPVSDAEFGAMARACGFSPCFYEGKFIGIKSHNTEYHPDAEPNTDTKYCSDLNNARSTIYTAALSMEGNSPFVAYGMLIRFLEYERTQAAHE
jgi:hypothetical protein